MKRGVTLPRPMFAAIPPRSGCLRRLRRRPATIVSMLACCSLAVARPALARRIGRPAAAALYSLQL
jgi:hypothetical protein